MESKYSKPAQKFLGGKIAKLRKEGYPDKQAVAIGLSYARKEGLKVPPPKKK